MYKTIELIKKTNVSRETIRYYEKRGLIHPVDKTEGGYKLYDEETVNKIKFIKKIQKLSFSLGEIEVLLKLTSKNVDPCEELIRMIDYKMKALKKKKSNLKKVKKTLQDYCSKYDHSDSECPIIRDFADLDLNDD